MALRNSPAPSNRPDYFFQAGKLPYRSVVYKPRWFFSNQQLYSVSEVTKQMASVLVGQFHARDAEGRVYPVHEFQESQPDEAQGGQPVITYRLAIGDRVRHLGGDNFELVQSGVQMTRTSS
ncbi:hypothetical protein ALQ61_05444 [Pseudomonas coronafaciens pv. zizaniae]|nr:hypothetical protein ALQ61_05444 [Pseudomonas coronafaciens pv. zizaniae]